MIKNVSLGWLAALLLSSCLGDPEVAKRSARKYAAELGYQVVGVACTSTDTDGDGYVSCTARVRSSQSVDGLPAPEETIALECTRGELTLTDGCKVTMPKMNVRTTVNAK